MQVAPPRRSCSQPRPALRALPPLPPARAPLGLGRCGRERAERRRSAGGGGGWAEEGPSGGERENRHWFKLVGGSSALVCFVGVSHGEVGAGGGGGWGGGLGTGKERQVVCVW